MRRERGGGGYKIIVLSRGWLQNQRARLLGGGYKIAVGPFSENIPPPNTDK